MFEIIFHIWYMIAILPILILMEGWGMFKKAMNKRGYNVDWIYIVYFLLAALIIFLIVLIANDYPL